MNRRTFLTRLAAAVVALALPVKWIGERIVGSFVQQRIWMPGGPLRIAAANASIKSKLDAHLIATGHNDQDVFDYAFTLMEDGGTILLSEGDFYVPDGFAPPKAVHQWWIEGSGPDSTVIIGRG